MEQFIGSLLEEASTNSEFRKLLLEDPIGTAAREGLTLSADERKFLESLPEVVAEGIAASLVSAYSPPIAQCGLTAGMSLLSPAQQTVAASAYQAGISAQRQAAAAGLSPSAQRFAAQVAARESVASQTASRNIQAISEVQCVTSRDKKTE